MEKEIKKFVNDDNSLNLFIEKLSLILLDTLIEENKGLEEEISIKTA
ncbi:hypothetical protein [Anaerobacillus alkalidiazotrophicus]|nr:hypothetical protein [Anaerobacillus alkalidiazotrophicus]